MTNVLGVSRNTVRRAEYLLLERSHDRSRWCWGYLKLFAVRSIRYPGAGHSEYHLYQYYCLCVHTYSAALERI